jgi:hypothetical protein
VPKHPRRVPDIGDDETPRLKRWRSRRFDVITASEIKSSNACPPIPYVSDEHVHHKMLGEVFPIIRLKQEGRRFDPVRGLWIASGLSLIRALLVAHRLFAGG